MINKRDGWRPLFGGSGDWRGGRRAGNGCLPYAARTMRRQPVRDILPGRRPGGALGETPRH